MTCSIYLAATSSLTIDLFLSRFKPRLETFSRFHLVESTISVQHVWLGVRPRVRVTGVNMPYATSSDLVAQPGSTRNSSWYGSLPPSHSHQTVSYSAIVGEQTAESSTRTHVSLDGWINRCTSANLICVLD